MYKIGDRFKFTKEVTRLSKEYISIVNKIYPIKGIMFDRNGDIFQIYFDPIVHNECTFFVYLLKRELIRKPPYALRVNDCGLKKYL